MKTQINHSIAPEDEKFPHLRFFKSVVILFQTESTGTVLAHGQFPGLIGKRVEDIKLDGNFTITAENTHYFMGEIALSND